MRLEIFDVEHGQCALLTTDNNVHILIDCGHSKSLGWAPGDALAQRNIGAVEMLIVTNYDEDHVSGLPNLLKKMPVRSLWRNKSVSGPTIKTLKTEDGYGLGIDALIQMIGTFTAPLGADHPMQNIPNLVRQGFYSSYPDFEDENNLSMAVHLKCHGTGVLFTGDLERKGWLKLLEQSAFRDALRDTDILIASHHGRESGCVDEVFEYCTPYFTIISDCGYKFDTQLTVPYYRQRSLGGFFRSENRHVLTTRRDGIITFGFDSDRWIAY